MACSVTPTSAERCRVCNEFTVTRERVFRGMCGTLSTLMAHRLLNGSLVMKSAHSLTFACALVLGFTASSFALGIRIADQDARATARGNAFAATADNPSAIYYNPAGITQLPGQQFRVGAYALTYQTRYRSPAGVASESQRAYEAVPQLYYTYSLPQRPLSVRVGVYAPFGLSMKWPENTGFRSAALAGRVQYLTVQPVIAWQATKALSIGIGPTFNYARTDLKQGLSPFAGNDSFRFQGDDFAPGFSAGVR